MLFVALLKGYPGTLQERVDRRVQWDYPEGTKIVAEYWLQTPDPEVVSIFEADHIGQIWAIFNDWRDVFDVTVFPAVAAQEGLEMLRQMSEE